MKESISTAAVFNIMIVFISTLLLFLIGSISYSKAFKVKNKIIEEIERDKGYATTTEVAIEKWLQEIGYRRNTVGMKAGCKNGNVNTKSSYRYCVYEKSTCLSNNANGNVQRGNIVNDENQDEVRNCGTFYEVVAYMYFDIPIIGDLLEIPVSGETLTFKGWDNIEDGVDFERNNS